METLTENQVHCLYCDKPINNRRKGAIYCSVKCGYTFRNHKAVSTNSNQRKIIKIIRKNDMIIHKIYTKNIFNISYQYLKLLGYNFDYHTRSIIENNSIVGAELFIYKIKKIEDNKFTIDKI